MGIDTAHRRASPWRTWPWCSPSWSASRLRSLTASTPTMRHDARQGLAAGDSPLGAWAGRECFDAAMLPWRASLVRVGSLLMRRGGQRAARASRPAIKSDLVCCHAMVNGRDVPCGVARERRDRSPRSDRATPSGHGWHCPGCCPTRSVRPAQAKWTAFRAASSS